MTLDLGHFREFLTTVTAGGVPTLRISKEWLAVMQSLMIFSSSFWRFYLNEGRSARDGKSGHTGPRIGTAAFAWISFAASSAIFTVIVWALLVDLPDPSTLLVANAPAAASIKSDIIVLQVLVLVWIGYPITAIAARLGHLGVPGDQYNATWSVIKDIAFAFLDITSKGGLAIFFVLKAAWVDKGAELALIATAAN